MSNKRAGDHDCGLRAAAHNAAQQLSALSDRAGRAYSTYNVFVFVFIIRTFTQESLYFNHKFKKCIRMQLINLFSQFFIVNKNTFFSNVRISFERANYLFTR